MERQPGKIRIALVAKNSQEATPLQNSHRSGGKYFHGEAATRIRVALVANISMECQPAELRNVLVANISMEGQPADIEICVRKSAAYKTIIVFR